MGHVQQPWRTVRVPGDLVIGWTRRSRALAADSWTAAEVPLAEEREAYEVEVLDGSAVQRTLSHRDDQRDLHRRPADRRLGALLGPGDTLDLRIYQLSAMVGRGAANLVTLQF